MVLKGLFLKGGMGLMGLMGFYGFNGVNGFLWV